MTRDAHDAAPPTVCLGLAAAALDPCVTLHVASEALHCMLLGMVTSNKDSLLFVSFLRRGLLRSRNTRHACEARPLHCQCADSTVNCVPFRIVPWAQVFGLACSRRSLWVTFGCSYLRPPSPPPQVWWLASQCKAGRQLFVSSHPCPL